MNKLKNSRVEKQLLIPFIFGILFILIVDIVGIRGMYALKNNSKVLFKDKFETLNTISNIQDNFSNIKIDLFKLVYQKNKIENDGYLENDIKSLLDLNNKQFEQYKNLTKGGEENKLVEVLKMDIELYSNDVEKTINSIKNNDYEKADSYFVQDVTPMSVGAEDTIKQIIDNLSVSSLKLDTTSNILFNNYLYGTISVTIIGLVASVLMGRRIVLSISK
ncbi:MCP four helix bundle domain-containing protein [Clostridium folliculivorans]|uniref:Chemotaxis methyl-accepting receptor HlyB-like 4HB MCP domain-containing protein n=1 Tax=Clostridium folliculivorans TaxID=2886038 RepID=A0A9W5Y4D7_9CLOT|nr:MCP four helix bundle domain-containing protein [Clostridium folliculivorans]GKU26247.1 hypothetical protein CFOLD11_30740 [Clostridium folliculivorans]GKU31919.1 hypothetical protein CFB3_40270 [Clostridium folliculivorans]